MGGKSYLAGISRQRSSQTASSIWRGKQILSWHSLQVLSECNSFSCKCTSVCANCPGSVCLGFSLGVWQWKPTCSVAPQASGEGL